MLALAIFVVFGVAYGKLVWTNRHVRRQEGKDEERRLAIEESRQSSQMVETRKSQDIPFGVRAIQSGIQVDGIWISKNAPPISSSLKLGKMRDSSSERSGNQILSPRAPQDSFQAAVHPVPSRGRTTRRESESGSFVADQRSKSTDVQDGRGYCPSYKPRRSSHLRYHSKGEVGQTEEALEQLEAKSAVETPRCLTEMDRGPELENDTFSGAAADNKRSTDLETDVTLTSNTKGRAHDKRQSLPVQYIGGKSLLEIARIASGISPRSSLPIQSSKASCLPVPRGPPGHEKLDPSTASKLEPIDTSLPFKPPYARTAHELTASGESQVPLLTHSRPPSPFIPGELHMNKSVRKVNSGFEVVPAGTFGVSSDFCKGLEQEDETGERLSKKLQKKIRMLPPFRRPSGDFGSP